MKHTARLLIACVVVVFALAPVALAKRGDAAAASAEPAAADVSGSPSTHFHASHLLDDVDGHHFDGQGKARGIVADKKAEIRKLSTQLLHAEVEVIRAKARRDALKKPALLWFFKADVRKAVHDAQRGVNEKAREVERVNEMIHGLWLGECAPA